MAQNGSISTKQRKAIHAMLTCKTTEEAAEAAGVGRRTLTRWLSEDEVFNAALDAAGDQAIREAVSNLAGDAASAARTLAAIHKDETISAAVRVRAARAVLTEVLKLREQRELAERVARLEELLNEQIASQ